PQTPRLRDGPLRVAGEFGADLDRDEAVLPAGRIVDGPEDVGGGADVGDRQRLEDRGRVLSRRAGGADVVVVELGLGDGLLEDRRIRRHPPQAVLLDEALQLRALVQVAADEVVPDALAELPQPLQRIRAHDSLPWVVSSKTPRRASSSIAWISASRRTCRSAPENFAARNARTHSQASSGPITRAPRHNTFM